MTIIIRIIIIQLNGTVPVKRKPAKFPSSIKFWVNLFIYSINLLSGKNIRANATLSSTAIPFSFYNHINKWIKNYNFLWRIYMKKKLLTSTFSYESLSAVKKANVALK